MIKINKRRFRPNGLKNLFTFAGLIFLLGISTVIVLQRLLPFARHTTYYCQSLINSFSVPASHYIGVIPFVLLVIFSLAASVKLTFILFKAQLLKKNLIKQSRSNSSFSELLGKLQLRDRTYLVESEKKFAFCLGVRKPKIYISTNLVNVLNLQEVEAVLRHERYHLENRDTLTMIIASIGESLLPFFPLLSDFLHNYRIEREIKADQEAILGLGDEKPLISVLRKLLGTPSAGIVSAAAIADHDTLEPRIFKLIKKETHFKKFKARNVIVSVFSAFIMGIIVLSPVQAVEVHHEGQDVVMICPHGEACLDACKQEHATDKRNYSEEVLYSPIE